MECKSETWFKMKQNLLRNDEKNKIQCILGHFKVKHKKQKN